MIKIILIFFMVIGSIYWAGIFWVKNFNPFEKYLSQTYTTSLQKEEIQKEIPGQVYEKRAGIHILSFSEKHPYKNGYFHGKKLKNEIQEMLWLFKTHLLPYDQIAGEPIYTLLITKAQAYTSFIPIEYQEEMQWIADWAEVSVNDILLINTYDDIVNSPEFLRGFWFKGSGCSSVVVRKGQRSQTFFHARNLDYTLSFLAKYRLVYRSPEIVSVWFPGYIDVLSGMNRYGITLSSHTAPTDSSQIGIPTGFLYRHLIEQSRELDQADIILRQATRTIANSFLLSSFRENNAFVYEISPKEVTSRTFDPSTNKEEKTDIKTEILVSTNHFLKHPLKDVFPPSSNSQQRYEQYFSFLSPKDVLISDDIYDLLGYGEDKVQTGAGWSTIANSWTVQSVLFEPESKTTFVAIGDEPPVTRGEYIEILFSVHNETRRKKVQAAQKHSSVSNDSTEEKIQEDPSETKNNISNTENISETNKHNIDINSSTSLDTIIEKTGKNKKIEESLEVESLHKKDFE